MQLTDDVREQAQSYLRHQSRKSLGELAQQMERTAGDCAGVLDGVSEEQAAFSHDDEWSIRQVVSHMVGSGRGVTREIENLARGRPSQGEARTGRTASPEKSIDQLRDELADLWVETGRLVRSLPEDASLEGTWEHPWFGDLNFREWIAFQRMHAMDHVGQMEKTKSHSDYPKS